MENDLNENIYNVGTGKDLEIKELAFLIQDVTGYKGEIIWDLSKPDGTPRKLLDTSKLYESGWKTQINLVDGVKDTYHWYIENPHKFKEVKFYN